MHRKAAHRVAKQIDRSPMAGSDFLALDPAP